MPKPWEEEIEKAGNDFEDARILRENNGSEEGIRNRLYFACYHAAKAILLKLGYEPKGHAGTVSLFGEHVVLEGLVSREKEKFLARSQTRREKADYEYEYDLQEITDVLSALKDRGSQKWEPHIQTQRTSEHPKLRRFRLSLQQNLVYRGSASNGNPVTPRQQDASTNSFQGYSILGNYVAEFLITSILENKIYKNNAIPLRLKSRSLLA